MCPSPGRPLRLARNSTPRRTSPDRGRKSPMRRIHSPRLPAERGRFIASLLDGLVAYYTGPGVQVRFRSVFLTSWLSNPRHLWLNACRMGLDSNAFREFPRGTIKRNAGMPAVLQSLWDSASEFPKAVCLDWLLRNCVFILFVLLLFLPAGATRADSVVVFNEIMYHPSANEAVMEWVELHNQMAVDVDLSGWSLAGGIDFKFAEGSVISGGGYLVVASSPGDLMNATGLTNVLGPFTGRLSNSGEELELRNNN